MAKRITIQDLAIELSTTPSTVSRALRGHPGISKSMKEKVNILAKSRGYVVNSLAANLRSGKSKTIGVIVPRVNRDFFSNVIAGIEEVAYQHEYSIIISQTHDKIDREEQCIKSLVNSRVDGILVSVGLETDNYDHFNRILDMNIPLIFFDRVCEGLNSINIVNNDKEGSVKAIDHLINSGYKRIAYISGPGNVNIYRDRKVGYISALKSHNIELDSSLIIENNLSIKEGEMAVKRLMSLTNPPDAIFAASDYPLLGAMSWLKNNGYRVPEDIGIVGYGNEKFTEHLDPSMTTLDQHPVEIGKYSAQLFFEELERVKSGFVPKTITISPNLIIRNSTARN